ncbi:MAG: amino acid ABC transporter permease [Planctomycetaceae bacterium]|nr:MAG: amino acid ABC transporter permease [Planctomycetaceae bacterium]
MLLWALGVGAVISGDFFGGNLGLKYAGFNGLAIATVLMAVMSLHGLHHRRTLGRAAHAGGFFSFTRSALGPLGGFLCGLTDTIEYVVTPAVMWSESEVTSRGGLHRPVPGSRWLPLVWWTLAYTIFVVINVLGVELTLRVWVDRDGMGPGRAGGLLCRDPGHRIVRHRTAVQHSSRRRQTLEAFRTAGSASFRPSLRHLVLPGIEQLPWRERNPMTSFGHAPALLLGIVTLLILSLLTLVLNTGVGGGAMALSTSDAPLGDGFRAVFGNNATSRVLGLVALTGLVASFHTIIYAYGRVLFALSRAGYFPRWISITGRSQTPWVALVLGAVVGLGLAAAIHFSPASSEANDSVTVGAVLLNMAVFGAVISYVLVMVSYIVLKITRPEMPRPYRSPLGIPGAAVGTVLAVIALAATFSVPEFRPGMYGVAIFLVIGLAWFLCYSRYHLVAQAPEEEVALLSAAQRELDGGNSETSDSTDDHA